jgi:hypothetical protein
LGPLCEKCHGAFRRDDLEAELARLRESEARLREENTHLRWEIERVLFECPVEGDYIDTRRVHEVLRTALEQREQDTECPHCDGKGCYACDARYVEGRDE